MKWEYTTRVDPDTSEMNALGEERWELVAINQITSDGYSRESVYIFKRQKP